MTSWFFVFDNGDFVVTKFVTTKSNEEIQSKFGGQGGDAGADDGRAFVSMWYFDEYSSKFPNGDFGYDCAKGRAYWSLTENAKIFNEQEIETVDLDKVFSNPPDEDRNTEFYISGFTTFEEQLKGTDPFDIWHN